jgi:hypothetical protein
LARWGDSRFNNADVERVLWWLHYFLKHVAPRWSLDLSSLEFDLWGFLKQNIYKNNPHTLEELKQNTELCISNITAETLQWVASNMRKRECMHCWLRWTFPTLNITLFFVFWFHCNLFFDK